MLFHPVRRSNQRAARTRPLVLALPDKLRFQFRHPGYQSFDSLRHFGFQIARYDKLSTIPLRRRNADQKPAFDPRLVSRHRDGL